MPPFCFVGEGSAAGDPTHDKRIVIVKAQYSTTELSTLLRKLTIRLSSAPEFCGFSQPRGQKPH